MHTSRHTGTFAVERVFFHIKSLSRMELKHFLILFINIIVLDCCAQSPLTLSGCLTDNNSAESTVGATIATDAKGLWTTGYKPGGGICEIRNIGTSPITAQCSILDSLPQTFELKLSEGRNIHHAALSENNWAVEKTAYNIYIHDIIVGMTCDDHPDAEIIPGPTDHWPVKLLADSTPIIQRSLPVHFFLG